MRINNLDNIQNHMDSSPLLVYIASDVRSGSTLLDLVLGSHPQIVSVGEIMFLNDHFCRKGTGYSWDWKCTCGKSFEECPFWTDINSLIEQKTGKSIHLHETRIKRGNHLFSPLLLLSNQWINSNYNKYSEIQKGIATSNICWEIVDAIHLITGKNIVVDSSKISEQLRYLYYCRPSNIKMIYLVRDGRGVVYSKMTRAGDSSRKAAKNWVLENIKLITLKAIIPKNQCLLVKYETLCKNPQTEIDRIFRFLGINSSIGHLSKSDRHNVCGSPHRFEWHNTKIQLDLRWKSNMSKWDRIVFGVIGGWLNFIFGYR